MKRRDFLEISAGVLPVALRGKSLRPLLEGRSVEWRNELVVETNLHRRFGQSGGVYGRMLRTQRCKYIVYSSGQLRETKDFFVIPGVSAG